MVIFLKGLKRHKRGINVVELTVAFNIAKCTHLKTSFKRNMNEFHIVKVVRVSPIKTVAFTIEIKKDNTNGRPKLDVLAKITLAKRGITERKEATNVIINKR